MHELKTEVSILTRLFDSRRLDPTPETASFLLSVKFDRADIERMNHLSRLAQEGSPKPDEEAQLDAYLEVGGASGERHPAWVVRIGRCDS